MNDALLPLLVVVPLAAAALTVLIGDGLLTRIMQVAVPLASIASGAGLLAVHRDTPVVAHRVGDFVPGVAIPLASDTVSALMLVVTGITVLASVVFAMVTGEMRLRHFPALTLMLLAGVNGALLTADMFNLFVFVEVMLLPSYALVAMSGSWRRIATGRVFVVVNLLTSTIFLIGVGLVYGVFGSVNLGVLAAAAEEDDRVALAAAVVLLALAVKAGVVPLHGWLPRAYPAASASVMALFSALHTKVAIYAIYRIYSVVFDGDQRWSGLILALVAVTMVVGAYSSLGERSARRALSFQMIAGVGFILVGVGLGTQLGIASGLFYMVHHILVMGALLLFAGAIEHTYGSGYYHRVSGLMRRDRLLAWGFALAAFSLIGMPPSSGFFGKVGVVRALSDADATTAAWLIGALVVASLGSLLTMQRMWSELFWGPPMEELTHPPAAVERGMADAETGGTDADGSTGAAATTTATTTELPDPTKVTLGTLAPGLGLLLVSLAVFVGAGPVWEICMRAAAGLVETAPYVEAVLR